MTANTQDIKKLTAHSHVRTRTEMYIGSRGKNTQPTLLHTEDGPFIIPVTWVPALLTSFREILDNSLDEITKSKVKNGTIRITYEPQGMQFTISDNGRGIPIDWDAAEGMHKVTMALTELMAGDNFDDAERKGTAGMNGIGGSTVAHVSQYFNVTVIRSGRPFNDIVDPTKEYTDEELDLLEANSELNGYKGLYEFTQSYGEGAEDDRGRPILDIDEPNIKKTKETQTGTTIEFSLSPEVFPNLHLPIPLIESLVREIAAANRGLKIYFNGSLVKTKATIIKTLFPTSKTVIEHKVNVLGFVADFYVIPNSVEEGTMQHGLVNNIPMFDGGEHIKAFKERFALGLIKALEKESKRRKLRPNRGDVEEGLLMYHITRMDGPYFSSQSKTQLINDDVYKIVLNSLSDDVFDKMIKDYKPWIEEIYARTSQRTNKKDMDEANREAKKNLRKKVAKLDDAHWAGKAIKKRDTILFLSEGDSANNMVSVKNNNIHGTLPLRGKILNVSNPKIGAKEVIASQSTADIMNALGLVPGEKATRNNLRYNSVCIAVDMDPDGSQIAALIVNFLFKHWPELFDDPENPFVQIFMTPFIILYKNNQREYFYLDNYDDFDPKDWKGWGIRRAKGLGSLTSIDWANTFAQLRVISIINDKSLAPTLDLLFNKDRADDRKQWMMTQAAYDAFIEDRK